MYGSFDMVMRLPNNTTSKHWAVCLFFLVFGYEVKPPDMPPGDIRVTQYVLLVGGLILWYLPKQPKE